MGKIVELQPSDGAEDVGENIPHLQRIEDELRYHIGFEDLILKLAARFGAIRGEDLDAFIEETLEKIARFTGAHTGHVFEFTEDNQISSCAYLWKSDRLSVDAAQLREKTQNMSIEQLPWLMGQLLNNQVVIVPSTAHLPAEAQKEKETLLAQGIHSIVDVPRLLGGKVVGFLGFSSADAHRSWSTPEITLLRLVGQFITNALERRRYEDELRERKKQLEEYADKQKEARQASEEQLTKIFQLSPSPISLSHLESRRLVDINEIMAETFGYTREEIIGKDILELNVWIDPAERAQMVEEVKHRGRVTNRQIHLRTRQGAERVLLASSAMVDLAGVPHLLTVANDVTEIRRVEEGQKELDRRLRDAHKLESLGILAGGIAHDFNNLLMAILGNADLLKYDLPEDAVQHQSVDEIIESAKRAAELAHQMLAYSGRGKFVIQRADLSEIVEEMASQLRSQIPHRIALQINLHNNLPKIDADPGQLQQMLNYLVTNAAEAIGSDRGGVITIKTGLKRCDREYLARSQVPPQVDEGEFVFLEMRDTGIGMDADTLEKLFDPFFSTKFTGRGLGLAATLGIIRGHRGAILVSSQPNRGTTFEILFSPIEATQAVDTRAVGIDEPEQAKRVLFVDDEDHVRSVACRLLEKAGYKVDSVSGGKHAIDLFRARATAYECIILDLSMPDMSGEETLAELLEINPEARVVLSSGFSEDEAVERLGRQPSAGFLHKPYDYQTLVETIKKAVGHSD